MVKNRCSNQTCVNQHPCTMTSTSIMFPSSTYIGFLNGTYIFLATMVVLVYDFLTHLSNEIDYWASQKMSFTKVLYVLCRAPSLITCCVRIPIVFIPIMEKLDKMVSQRQYSTCLL
ncbi:uncharacterized protein EDB91DRAFT_332770 [Suillus paluster]|uniref:uncharacterized protein n=1 Tax=Suillus paluster TaxID=48578 RepID=UPI001B87CA18|nr:uncharacterized protein EDB91DRAFT_332770 [Suillus paluster]KAG1741520.1 hypothetical protein EDB91DRAFT_332770 [Suillus paluster]